MLAAVLLTPLLLATSFMFAVNAVATGHLFTAMVLIDAVLPANPDLGALVLVASGILVLSALLFACLKWNWVFPCLLILLGGLAQIYVTSVFEPDESGSSAFPILGWAGMACSSFMLWRLLRPR